jgi:two-component system phosphate regulon response regulator OmpR
MLRRYLGERGFAVQTAEQAERLDGLLQREPYDALVLDITMPHEDGLSVCRRLRATGQTIPILMLTARGDPADRIVGLEMGADDYLAKPFEPRELIARLNAMLRRQGMARQENNWGNDEIAEFGPFTLNVSRMELLRHGEAIPLTNMEFRLLRIFAANPRRPLSRDHLQDKLKGRDSEALDRSIDVQISRLRGKIENKPTCPKYVRTIWGVGYMFVPDGGHV